MADNCDKLLILDQINDIFTNALPCISTIENEFGSLFEVDTKRKILYYHNNIMYRGSVHVDKLYCYDNKIITNLCIKLVSSGFVYDHELDMLKENIDRHNNSNWCLLESEYYNEYEKVINWSKDKLRSNKVQVQVFHNFVKQVVDVKITEASKTGSVKHDSQAIIVSFKHGYSEVDFNDECLSDAVDM